jgi:hypothetical protein
MGEKGWIVFGWEPMTGGSRSKVVSASSKEEAERNAYPRLYSPTAWPL